MPKAEAQNESAAENAEKAGMPFGTLCKIFRNLSRNGCMGRIDENAFRFFCMVREMIDNEAATTAPEELLIMAEVTIGND